MKTTRTPIPASVAAIGLSHVYNFTDRFIPLLYTPYYLVILGHRE